jgi:MscS family membrane protein
VELRSAGQPVRRASLAQGGFKIAGCPYMNQHRSIMSCRNTISVLLLACVACVAVPSFAQLPSLPTRAATAAIAPVDPLNRATPSGSVLGFLQAAQSGEYGIASQYLQMSAAHRQVEGEEIATQLKAVMDAAFVGKVGAFNQPDGIAQEGVPLGHQKIGTMSSGDVEVDLDLVRINDPSAGKIWLVSADTLVKVPELYDQVQARRVEHRLPSILVKHQISGMPLWQWLGLLLAIPVATGFSWLILALIGVPVRWWTHRHGTDIGSWHSVHAPIWLLFATIVDRQLVSYLGMPLLQRHYYYEVLSISFIIAGTWILWRFVRWSLQRVRLRALARGHAGTGSLILLGERIIKASIFLLGIFAALTSLGFNMSTALAGLGIGGLAIGFGAQQTIANLFGGVSVLGDEVIRVGDVCRFGDRTGTVEDIGLRSTRVRTDERTLLAIPNGTVASINVENLSRRDKILFTTKLGLKSDSKPDHVRYVLAEIRQLLATHAKVESKTIRVRLTDVAGSSLTIEVFAYVLTREYNEYAAIREDLLLRMMDIVEESGSGLATPSQTLYLAQDAEKEKAGATIRKMAASSDPA